MRNKALKYALKYFFASLGACLIIFALVFLCSKLVSGKKTNTPTPVFDENNKIRFVIDAGHGGEDAGAVASDGTMEKELNLEIATLIGAILELNGNEVLLTRTEDTLLYDYYGDLDDYTGHKKIYDLKNRLKIAEEEDDSIYIGIHMNKFPMEKYSGLQVYYSKNNALSYLIAKDVQATVKASLQPQNNRGLKIGDSSIYILNGASIPAILIECGFLSNEKELANLKSEKYQRDLSLCIFASIAGYSN